MKKHRRIISCIIVLMMLVCALSVFSVGAFGAGQGSTITLTMQDSYGDGWNGNKIEVYTNGTKSGSYTVSDGYSATYSISYDSSNSYEFKWVKGSYPSECSFTIKLDGSVLLSATQTQCSSYADNYSLLTIASVQEDMSQYDLEGEFAGGSGTTYDPYLVATKAQLNNVRDHLNSHFRQVGNIVFNSSDFGASGDFYNDGHGWEPIGDYNSSFGGSYDGNGYTIDGLTITTDGSKYTYIGLFGYVYGDIVNVKLTNINYAVTGGGTIGGIVGYASSNQFIGCYVSGVINAKGGTIGGITGFSYKVEHCESNVYIDLTDVSDVMVGGIVGWAFGDIKYCKNSGSIVVDGTSNAFLEVGGIAGNSSAVTECKNSGNITVGGASDMECAYVGGISGRPYGNISRCENTGTLSSCGSNLVIGGISGELTQPSTMISECVNRGNVSAVYPTVYSYVGGIVGDFAFGTVQNCYTTDTVTLTARGTSDSHAGGIAGIVWHGAELMNCYSLVNSVSVNTSASGWGRGGIAGCNYGTIEKCYYRYTYGAGYNAGSFSGTRYSTLSNYESSSIYSGFDFTSVWKMGTETYKYAVLRMESGHTHSLSYNAATVTYDAAGNLENWYCSGCQSYFRNSSGTRYVTTDMLRSDPVPREGECGNDLSWKLTNEGDLTIYGNGKMTDYTDSTLAPWYEFREKIKNVTVKSGVTSIGSNAFKGCTNLTKFTFADSIETIGSSAFSGCSSITQLQLPKSVISVGDKAFSSITKLIVCFEGSAPSFGGSDVFSGTSVNAYYPSDDSTWTSNVIQGQTGSVTWESFTSVDEIIIASGEFYSSGKVNWSVSLSGKLVIKGAYSSMDLPDYNSYSSRPVWDSYKDRITSVELINFSRIGSYTFYDYPALKSVNFGTVDEVGSYAFAYCDSLENVFLADYYAYYTKIEKYAFYGCSSLKHVAFPDHTTIGEYAFAYCSKIKDIYIASYNNYSSAPMTASSNSFYGVTANVYVPTNWGYFKDYGDFGGDLTWKEAPYGPCGYDAFWSYDANTSTITITGTGTFASYSSGSDYPWYGVRSEATKIVIEDGITYISAYVFEYMSNIRTVILPNTLQKLSCNAFNDCKSLNNLVFPASLTEFVDGYYFNRCNSLTDVYYMGTAEEWSNVANTDVLSTSYDYIKNIHFLILTEQSEATCTAGGTNGYYRFDDTSVYSGYYNLDKQPITYPEFTEALGHDEISHDGKSATCTENGWHAYVTCSRCDYTTYSEISKTGHSYGEWYITVAPTCVKAGEKRRDCTKCDHYVIEITAELGHDEISHDAKDATCTENGWQAYVSCSRCDYSTYSEILATGHNVSDWIIDEEATYEKDGKKHKECTLCHETIEISIVPMLTHSYVSTVTPPTCTEQGYTTHVCLDCGNEYIDDYVYATGHNFGEWSQIIAPGYESLGQERRDCTVCDYYETKDIAPIGYSQAFINTVKALSDDQSAEVTYSELYSALQLYAKMTDEEKQEVNEYLITLQQAVESYNAKATVVNDEAEKATELAFVPIATNFAFLAALWALLKKKLFIK